MATGFGPAPVVDWLIAIRDDRVAKATIELAVQQFSGVVIALTEKYGAPQTDQIATIQNRAGAKFDNRVVVWNLQTGTIRAEQRFGSVDRSRVVLAAPGVVEQEREESEQRMKAGAKPVGTICAAGEASSPDEESAGTAARAVP